MQRKGVWTREPAQALSTFSCEAGASLEGLGFPSPEVPVHCPVSPGGFTG